MLTPSQEYNRIHHRPPLRLHKGLDAAVHNLIGAYRRRASILKELESDALRIDALAPSVKELSSHDLRQKLLEYRQHFRRHGSAPAELLIQSLAAIREAADREVGLRPFVVQLMGALALHRGYLAEMATGEGKTLTAGLAAVMAGWTKHPCHIVTVNDYLVGRDTQWLTPLYHFCSVSVGCVTAAMPPDKRREGYLNDVTYVTSKELLADFLRDRIQLGVVQDPTRRLIRSMLQSRVPDRLVTRGIHTAIIDEADSVLIDEAVTPLIISTAHKNEILREASLIANEIVGDMQPELDYTVDLRYREIELTEDGRRKLTDKCSSRDGLWRGSDRRLDLVRQALTAREFFHRGKQYVVSNDKVVIVDEFTGRPMPQRSWRQGLHQAIEAKEGVALSDPTETVARLSFQRFFRLFERLSGMTGTAHEAASEFWHIYRLPVVSIPTNRPCIRVVNRDRFFVSEPDKWNAIVNDVVQVHATGRPVLVGTRNVAASERLAALLTEKHVNFRLLNAINHREEAAIIAEAGEPGKITIATNMAGRGTDIKLGKGVADLGGLHVIATERHESRRIDRQLFGRSARQGDPGSAQGFASIDDELFRRYLSPALYSQFLRLASGRTEAKQTICDAASGYAQHRAQRLAFRQRNNILKMDDWLESALAFTGTHVT